MTSFKDDPQALADFLARSEAAAAARRALYNGDNPFLTDDKTLVSVSGGRTSGLMLRRTLDAHGGTLPTHVLPVFANTGKERAATLNFVQQMATEWGAPIVWLEWRPKAKFKFPYENDRTPAAKWWLAAVERCGDDGFEVVTHNTASRFGEPFAALCAHKKAVPNWQARWCTGEMKVLTIKRYLQSLGWTAWMNMVGLRFDEVARVIKKWEQNDAGKEPWKSIAPLYQAGLTKTDVSKFWQEQPFDLQLGTNEGNCDDCFLKGKRNLLSLIAKRPPEADWWSEQEVAYGATFSSRYSYAELKEAATRQGDMFVEAANDNDGSDAECGDSCAYDGYDEEIAA